MSRTNEVHTELLGFFGERTVAIVNEQVVRSIKITDVDIQIPIVVDVGHGRAGTPSIPRIQLGGIGHVFELHRTGLAK